MILSGGKNVMTLIELNETIFALEKQIEMLNTQMIEICDNRDMKISVMPKAYYGLLKERQCIEAELSPLWNEQSRLRREMQKNSTRTQKKTFVNSYGEATKREITNVTYQRAQKRMEKSLLVFVGK